MRSSTVVSLAAPVLAYALGVAATSFDWVHGLDDCWRNCLDSNGCESQQCICDASATDSYLLNSLECAKSECDTAGWVLELGLLAPLQVYCAASGDALPESVIDSAYDCATSTSITAPTTTRKVEHSTTARTTRGGGSELQDTTTSTFTQTTTDGEGHTVKLVVPIIMGPDTMFTGKIVTSTLEGNPTTMTSTSATTTQTDASTAVEPTQAQGASSSTPTAEPTQAGPASGSGSPFENMQAGSTRFGFSSAVIGVGLLAGAFVAC